MSLMEKPPFAGAAEYRTNYHRNYTPWRRVTARSRCPICGALKFCRVSPDGAVAGCMREDRGAFKTSDTRVGPMYLHRLRYDYPRPLRTRQAELKPTPQAIASADHRHAVYSELLDHLTLSAKHAHELGARRGLSEETVTRNLYATVPDGRELLMVLHDLAAKFDLSAIPGFWREGTDWQCAVRCGELLIAVRDEHERISAILRGTGTQPKYVWMSNANRSVSCGTPLHFALPYLADLYPGTNIIVTEGVLKADVVAEQLHRPVVGSPGTTIPDDIGQRLARHFPTMSGVSVAFDADEPRNHHVRRAVIRLLQLLRSAGIVADRLVWDEALGKGLDDVLLGGAK